MLTDPLLDGGSFAFQEQWKTSSSPLEGSYLDTFATLPGVTVGETTDSELAGIPARSMTYSFGDVEGGFECADTGKRCIWAYWIEDASLAWFYNPGDSGTLYELDVAGQTVVVEVIDREGRGGDRRLAAVRVLTSRT